MSRKNPGAPPVSPAPRPTRRARPSRVALAAGALGVLLASCTSSDSGSDRFESVGSAIDEAGGWVEGGSGAAPVAPESADEALAHDGYGGETAGRVDEPDDEQVTSAVLAGSVDDNERWDDYLLYRAEALASGLVVHDVAVEGRQVVTVADADGRPVLGAEVVVRDTVGAVVARLRTYADGRAVFHPPVVDDRPSQDVPDHAIEVSRDGVSATSVLPGGVGAHEVVLDVPPLPQAGVDVHFLVDTTGSMGDEIARLQATMVSVAERVAALPGSGSVRFAMTTYRDRGDEYVTRTFDFTSDVAVFTEALRGVVADGGGDTPEDLNAGLHDAITVPSWRTDTSLKLVFLLADAPPHLDYDGPDYAVDVLEAAAQGIKIVPIASSGLDAQGEFVFRQLAQITMGRFVFLTYGADGATPGTETDHQVDDYSVLALDDLVVRLVADELAHQGE